MHCHPLAILLALGLGAAAVHGSVVEDGEGAASSAGGRRLRRNPGRRQMQDVLVEEDAQEAGESIVVADFGDDGTTTDAPLGGQNLCKTIIAIDGWRIDQRKGGRELLQPPDDAGIVDLGLGDIDLLGDGNATAPHEDVNIPYEDDPSQQINTDEEFVCELRDGKTLPLQGTREQLAEMRTLLNNGTLVSAQSSVVADRIGGSVSDGEDGEYAIAASAPEAVALPPGSIQLIHNEEDDFSRRRRLNRYNGDKRFLIVIVKDKDGRVIPEKANVVSNKWFGTSGDPVNMARGFKECSFNKFRATWNYGNALDSNQKSKLSAKGVIEVTIPIRITTSTQEQIRYAAVVAVQQKLQMMLPGPFDHVVFLVKKCHEVGTTCAFAAYAYVKHWLSVFVEDNWKYAAVQMHEIGHNLNMAHSGGLDRKTYTDHTCLMGNPLWEDNVGRMCFNPVKAFQINKANGWYNPSQVQTWNSGTTEGATWSGRLLGVARGGNNPHNHPIVLKLETGGRADWFIGYNHAVGPNSDTVQGRNRVTVYKVAGGDGLHYSHSHLKAILRANQRGTINNWRNTGKNLYIQVKTVSASASAGYADVTITFGQSTPPPTPKPTKQPTPLPTTPNPTMQPTPSPSKAPSTSPSKAPSSSPTIKTPDPTSQPSRSPTASPSDAPTTAMPSKAPSQAPSPAPTGLPSSNPSLSPTLTTSPSLSLSPSVNPTAKPTTAPPTARPTARPTNQCGNGICDASESSSSCPADCITSTFTATNSNGGRSSSGQMWTVKAKRSVKLQAVQVVGKSNARSRCMVFTRRGSYRGHARNQGSWTKLVDRWVNMRSGRTVSLGNFNRLVALKAGETQALYVHCTQGMLYARGNNEGARYSGNNALDLQQGIGTRGFFGKKVRRGKFRGAISYVETR